MKHRNQYTQHFEYVSQKMLTSRKSNFTAVNTLVTRDGTLLAKTSEYGMLSLCLRFEES